MVETALVLGANGQDGRFLARNLLARGHQVVGVGRQDGPREVLAGSFRYASLDLRDDAALSELLNREQPDAIYHVAAVHASSTGDAYEPVFGEMLAVNVGSVHTVLEYMRLSNPAARLLYASSAKAFGSPLPPRVHERTPRRSDCLYAVTKNAAHDLIERYRLQHGVQASVLFLFNHESELRPAGFFVPTLLAALKRALAGEPGPTELHTLRFHCDWGSAEEYMDLAVDVLERAPGEDVVLATGVTHLALDVAQALFARHGLSLADHVRERTTAPGPPPFQVDLAKLESLVGRTPRVQIAHLLDRILTRVTPSPT